MRRTFFALALAAVVAAAPAFAAESGGGGRWSVLSGGAVGQGHLAIQLQAGWPAVALAGHLGYNDKLDLGARAAFTWGQDGSLFSGPGAVSGLRIQGSARYQLLGAGAVTLGADFAPGFGLDVSPGLTTARILLPLGLTLGIQASDALLLHAGVDLPIYVTPGTFGGLTLPILFGGGAEYRLDRSLEVTGRLRVGPALELTRTGAPARFAFELAAGLAFRT